MQNMHYNQFCCWQQQSAKRICRSGGTGRRTGLKILRWLNTVPVRFRSSAPSIYDRNGFIAGWSSWQLVGLITRRSQVQVLLPQPINMAEQLSWLEHSVHTRGVVGSSPISATIYAEVAEQADAQDLKSCGSDTVPVRFRSSAPS